MNTHPLQFGQGTRLQAYPSQELMCSGHLACPGCGAAQAMRWALKSLGENTMVVIPACCWSIIAGPFPYTALGVPLMHTAFETAGAAASGVRAALDVQGKSDTTVMAWAGDGGTFDIGIQSLSAAAERNEDIIYVCYDNEAYMNCLSTTSYVTTADGLRNITDIKDGDMVYTFDEDSHKLVLKRCIGVFKNGSWPIFELETFHHTVKATSNHPFLVLQRNGRGKSNTLVWKTLREIKKGDMIVVLKNMNGGTSYGFNFNKTHVGDYKVSYVNEAAIPKHTTPELMKYLGLYVGDGWVRPDRGEVGFALPKGKAAREILVGLQEKLFQLKPSTTDENYVYINSVNLARFVDSLGFGKGAKNKTIAPWVFTLPRNEKEAFVEGLILSDGYRMKDGKSIRYVSASTELLRTLRLLLQTVNYRVGKIHMQSRKKGTFCVYRELKEDTEFGYICFSKKRNWNLEKYKNQYRYQNLLVDNECFDLEKVTNIRCGIIEPTLDLRVEENHNFIANGMVVHNTGVQRSSATPLYAWTTTTPEAYPKQDRKKNIDLIMAAHKIPYVATTTSAHPHDLMEKFKKARNINGTRFIHILATCIPGWRIASEDAVAIARMAVDSKIFPVFEIFDGEKLIINIEPKNIPIKEYLKRQGRFRHLTDVQIAGLQEDVDRSWANLVNKFKCNKII